MNLETLVKSLTKPVIGEMVAEEPADHERVVQSVRPSATPDNPERAGEKTVRVRLLVLEMATFIRKGAEMVLGKNPTPRSQPRPKAPEQSEPSPSPEPPFGSARWAETQLNKATNLLEKMAIVDRLTIGSEIELTRALNLLQHNCDPTEAELLQSKIAVENQGWQIPLKAAVKVLRIPRVAVVQRLLIDRLEKTKPTETILLEMMAVLKSTDTMSYLLSYFNFALEKTEPIPGDEAYLTPTKITTALKRNSNLKPQHHFGLADGLKPDPRAEISRIDQALELAVLLQDPEAIRIAFIRIGVKLVEI